VGQVQEEACTVVVSGTRLGLLAAVGLLLSALLVAGCTGDPSTFGALNAGPQSSFFFGLSGDGYVAYKMYGVQEGEMMVILVGVRVDTDNETRATYDTIYDHATSSAKEYGIATDKGERLRVVLVEATSEHKVLEQRDFDLASTDDGG
jgi:hypothetical protein